MDVPLSRFRLTPTVTLLLRGKLLMCLVFVALSSTNAAAQEKVDGSAIYQLDREITFQLFDRDIVEVANQLAAEHATSVGPLLRRLFVYSRAGHHKRVLETLEQLSQASDWQAYSQSPDVRLKVMSAIPANDFEGWRFYFDHLSPGNPSGAEQLVKLWAEQGDPQELDLWLADRSTVNDAWLQVRLRRLASLGRAGEVLDPMAVAVRARPDDFGVIQRYLWVNRMSGNAQDVGWLADVCKLSTAAEYFELGYWLQIASMQTASGQAAAARLFEKSLALPFTEKDLSLVQSISFRLAPMAPARVNWEKQLRFWTRQCLAQVYLALNRPKDAQPLVEELVAMNGDDILKTDVHKLAGVTQAGSGQRVVESRVLRDEASRRESATYWIERANYYDGRNEFELELDTYRKALEAVPLKKDVWERLEIVRWFAFSLWSNRDEREDWRAQIEKVLRHEFTSVRPETEYAFRIAYLIVEKDFELDELRRSFFVEQPNLLARVLTARGDWEGDEEALIERVVRGDGITVAERNRIWSVLEKLVTNPGSPRAVRLAQAMDFCGDSERALPFFLGYLKQGRPNDDYLDREQILSGVISGYCQKGAWEAAEQLLFNYKDWAWPSMPSQLGVIAISAAHSGAANDALRLWRIKANLDRRDLEGLERLSKTAASQPIRAYYLRMKKDDPLTSSPDLALPFLR